MARERPESGREGARSRALLLEDSGSAKGRGVAGAPHPERLLDVREAAALLGLKSATLYQWAYKRRIPVVKLFGPRGALRFRLSDVEKLIQDSLRPAIRPLGAKDQDRQT